MTGALISVGTFRVLAQASQGKFSEVVMLDIDQSIVAFNKRQIDALKVSRTAAEFFANLCEEPSLAPVIEEILNGRNLRLSFTKPDVLAPASREDLINYSPAYIRQEQIAKAQRYVSAVLSFAKTDAGGSFLTNPKAFRRLRKLAMGDHITAIAADLSGTTTLAAVADRLKQHGIEVSVFDPSNALDYISRGEKRENYLRNLRNLPFASNAIVNFTHWLAQFKNGFRMFAQRHGVDMRSESWDYLSVPASEYVTDEFVSQNNLPSLLETKANLLFREVQRRSCRAIFSSNAY